MKVSEIPSERLGMVGSPMHRFQIAVVEVLKEQERRIEELEQKLAETKSATASLQWETLKHGPIGPLKDNT